VLDDFIDRYGEAPASGPESIKWGINPADSHPGPNATHFFAVEAADFIEQRWPAALGTKDESHPPKIAINDWMPFDLNVRQIDEQTFELEYPAGSQLMYQPPGEEATALVALRYPTRIARVILEGDDLDECRVWALFQAEEHLEPEPWRKLERFLGGKLTEGLASAYAGTGFVIPVPTGFRLSALRFAADFQGPNRRLRLSLVSPTTNAD
jgi:hypothetical protein